MYVAQERQSSIVPPALSMDPLSTIDRLGPSYPAPSSANVLPSIPRSPQESLMSNTVADGRIYRLEVVQQPIRARMCGFGDKDRRPITPPPCIRLVVLDATTKKEIDINDIDTAFFVLTVDLWSADALREVNLVRHSATSPSISAATSSSYPPPSSAPSNYPAYTTQTQQVQLSNGYGQSLNMHQSIQSQNIYQQSPGYQNPSYQQNQNPSYQQNPSAYQQQQSMNSQPQSNYYHTSTPTPITPTSYYQQQLQPNQGQLTSPQHLTHPTIDPRSSPSGMFTRNLIGSLCVSAFKLTNPENQMGVWFILQDLSVRTEGSFRLKMNFVNVGAPSGQSSLNTGTAPVLATNFSDVFQVFSAKKFPGVIESTALSKCFATQGIKIPIRKDGPRGNLRDREVDDD